MALIQNAICNKEGKKWKQRWAVLKEKVGVGDSVLYLIIYKDASHAASQKQKWAIQLLDFCGLNVLSQHEKFYNVLVVATTTQTHFLSFDTAQICDEWRRLLVNHFGEDTQFAVTIPGKQRLKAGAATLRVYQRFFSIITCKNYVSIGRWYCEDVYRYAALDESLFSFEIKPAQQKRSGNGQQINLAIEKAAEDVVKVFDLITQEESGKIGQSDFHGSGILDELGRGDRDQNFLQRCLLRVSNRVRKHKRNRAPSDLPPKRRSPVQIDKESLSPSNSISAADEAKWRSLDRKKNPDISVKLDDATREQVLAFKSKFYRQKSEGGRLSPEVRASESSQDGKSSVSSLRKSVNASESSFQRLATLEDDRHASDHVFTEAKPELGPLSKKLEPVELGPRRKGDWSAEDAHKSVFAVDDDLVVKAEQKRTVDSLANAIIQRQSSEMPRALKARTNAGKKKHKSDTESQPTPPPRSPISLGLTGPVSYFEFPSSDDVKSESCDSGSVTTKDSDDLSLSTKTSADGEQEKDNSLEQIDADVCVRTHMNGDDLNVIDEMSCGSADESEAPPVPAHSKTQRCGSESALAPRSAAAKYSISSNGVNPEPEYRNIDLITRQPLLGRGRVPSDEEDVRRRISCNRDPSKHSSDPLVLDNWSRATGEGAHMISNYADEPLPIDYVNVSGKNQVSDDEHGSYVNVSGSEPMRGRKINHAPSPLFIKQSRHNDFSKYDDEESAGVYQYFGNNFEAIRGSYEGVNGAKTTGKKRFDYHNVMSPKSNSSTGSLNYVDIAGSVRPARAVSSSSSSPVIQSPGRLAQRANGGAGSEYTMIDKDLTSALQQSKLQLQKQREGIPVPQKTAPVKKAKP